MPRFASGRPRSAGRSESDLTHLTSLSTSSGGLRLGVACDTMASSEEPHGPTQRDGCSALLVPEACSPCSEMSSSALQPSEVGTVVVALADPAPEAAASEEPPVLGVRTWDARHGVGACA
eukprot:scaffold98040_cov49-Phaeocystis_antarctica.AAC.1